MMDVQLDPEKQPWTPLVHLPASFISFTSFTSEYKII